jgi:hypothetical protein
MEIAKELLSKLDYEVELVGAEMRDDKFGLILLTSIKETDYYYYNVVRNDATETTSEQFYLIQLGLPQLIYNALLSSTSYREPIITFRSKKSLIIKTLERVARLGMVQHGRRMCYAAIAKECELSKANDTLFEFSLPKKFFNYESHEGFISRHYEGQIKSILDNRLKDNPQNTVMLKEINSLLTEKVFVFENYFIGYDAHPLLDVYFFNLAQASFQGNPAFDAFKYNVVFGGLQYQHYYIALCYIVSLSLKHERFCETLIKKNTKIELRDILTISCDRNSFIESIEYAVNEHGKDLIDFSPIDALGAKQLYEVFSIRRNNLPLITHIDFPLLIEFSDSSVVRSIAGAQFRPGEFLLESLKYNFPRDYDKNQNDREGSMQREIERILNEFSPSLITKKNIVLRKDRRILTDIDFVVVDEAHQHVLLFQLKHQDEYGPDMKKRYGKGKRLKEETESWCEQMNSWLSNNSAKEVNSALQLPKGFKLNNVYLVAIAKHFAHFLSPLAIKNANFVYGTWMQFYDAIKRVQALEKSRTLLNLFEVMREYMTHKIATPQEYEGTDEYILDNCTFKISKRN